MAMDLDVRLATGESHRVTPENPDLVRFDLTAARHEWPAGTDAPFLWLTFLAWSYMARTGAYHDTFEQFQNIDCLAVDRVEDDEDDETPKSSRTAQPEPL